MPHYLFQALVVAAVATAWRCNGNVRTCKSAGDCSAAELCVAGTCRPSCLDNSGCPSDTFCLRGACMPVSMSCTTENDCPSDYTCRDGTCGQYCNNAEACPLPFELCVDGACTPNPSPECRTTSECHTTAPCESDVGSRCIGGSCVFKKLLTGTGCDDGNNCTPETACNDLGRCVGASLPCDAPPSSSCNVADDSFQSYVDVGVCKPEDGTCDYAHLDFPCPSCTAVCLERCAGLTCDETHGGCQYSGICVPDDPPRCQYDVVLDGTTCDLPGDLPGSQRGKCATGLCGECLAPADCTTPPAGPTVCFVAECNLNHCDYVAQPAVVCAAQTCTNGTKTLARTCGGDGACPATGTASCGGYACAPNGVECSTACTGSGASSIGCVSSYVCNGGICEATAPAKALGEGCGTGAECQSTFCADSRCCDGDCVGACKACGADGHCNVMPADDDACGTVDCDTLDVVCRDYHDLTSGRCKALGQCKVANSSADCTSFTNAGAGAQPAGCNVCKECNGSGGCGDVPSPQQRTGCNAAATGCSGADTCNGTGGCSTNDFAAGTEGSCGTCWDCNGSGACDKVRNGQQDNGCSGGGGTCKDSDTCEDGGCDYHYYDDGVRGGCGTCKVCNGGGGCREIASGNTDAGCDGACQTCQGGGCSSQTQVTCYADNDGDDYAGPGAVTQTFCNGCGTHFTTREPGSMGDNHTDCNDDKPDMNPGADFSTSQRDCNGPWDCDCVAGITLSRTTAYNDGNYCDTDTFCNTSTYNLSAGACGVDVCSGAPSCNYGAYTCECGNVETVGCK